MMKEPSPEKRVIFGRNIALTAGILYCLSRSVYYTQIREDDLSGAQEVITASGSALGIWAALWGLAAIFCVVDMVNRNTRHGLSIMVGIAFGWGIGYAVIWAATGFTDYNLISSAISWITPAGLVFGFLMKVSGLRDMLRRPEEEQ